MQEESNVHVGNPLSKHTGKEKEVIVVDDDNIAGLIDGKNAVCELLVHPVIICP
jgi:hypothetical protein